MTTRATCSSAGRSDDTIIRGGENIAPAEVEDVLVEHPDVHEVAVVGVDDPSGARPSWPWWYRGRRRRPTPKELREHVRSVLRGSRTPDRVVFRDELPTNADRQDPRREILDGLSDANSDE